MAVQRFARLCSFILKVGSLEHQDAQVWSRAHPLRPTRTVSSRSREGFRDILRALWRRGREVCSPASRLGIFRTRRGAHGEVFFGASRRVRGREARRGLQPGVTARYSSARVGGRVAKFSSVRVGVCEGTKRGGVCSPATCGVCGGLVTCRSINLGRPGVLLGSSVAFGSGCG